MDILLSYPQIQQLIIIKLLFFVLLVFGIIAIYKKMRPSIFLIVFGGLTALGYAALVHGTQLSFWGLKGDEITIAAMYQGFAYKGMFSDFAYSYLPAFYPALFFQIIAIFGRFMHLNGVQMAKVGTAVTFAFFPIMMYAVQAWYWKDEKKKVAPVAWMLGVLLVFMLIPWASNINKPYELVSGVGVILWSVFLARDIYYARMNWKRVLVYGCSGGVLFLLFYFWFALAALGVAIFHLFNNKKTRLKDYALFAFVGSIVLAIGSIFLLPLIQSYYLYGSENWQLGLFTIEGIATSIPLFSLSLSGLVAFVGLLSLIIYRKVMYIRILLSLFVAGNLWQIMGMVMVLFFASPMQEAKGFLFFNTPILALAAAYALAQWYLLLEKKKWKHITQKNVGLCALLLFVPTSIFGTFADDENVLGIYERSIHNKADIVELLDFFGDTVTATPKMMVSGLPELHAFLTYDDVLYFNQHNSHPAAQFSETYYMLNSIAEEKNIDKAFDMLYSYDKTKDIDYFVLYAKEDAGYPLIFDLDDFPGTLRGDTIWFSKELFESSYFIEIYRSERYAIFTYANNVQNEENVVK
ncbi:hypothetical protein KKG22_04710 [Patescibacteria group bacterium]|nr:hypothetical protein [Patescibacteria group bacterium]MBU1721637.1 hypothetical protein [Patescibacteria group bacterium]MBU1901701.1 hypothetical protein [Patescibacteria group bacterium]